MDLVIRNALIVDGSGRPAFVGDLATSGDTICAVGAAGAVPAPPGATELDATGLAVAPGFIDIHSHTDLTLALNPRAKSKVRQGVTTEVVGNCGFTAAPVTPEHKKELLDYLANTVAITPEESSRWDWQTMAEHMQELAQRGLGLNIVPLVGQGTIRVAAMGLARGAAPPTAQARMEELLEQELAAGVFGMSSGLAYPPNNHVGREELAGLCRVLARWDRLWTVHIRDEGDNVLAALEEVLAVAEETGVKLQVSHLKVVGRRNWGRAPEVLTLLSRARDRGIRVMADQYPYLAYGSSLLDFLPLELVERGAREILATLQDPARARAVAREIEEHFQNEKLLDWDDVLVASLSAPEESDISGKSIAQLGREWHLSPGQVVVRLLQKGWGVVKTICFAMGEEDIVTIMRDPTVMIASDGRAVNPGGVFAATHPHPRYYGTFPRVLGRYVREKGVLSLEEAVRKMTLMPAQQLNLCDRGLLLPGYRADLVLFDPEEILDRATFTQPHQFPEGIPAVIINGVPVIWEGEHTGALPGRLLSPREGGANR